MKTEAQTGRLAPAFSLFPPQHGLLLDMADDEFPTSMWCLDRGSLALPAGGTHFGFVFSGQLEIPRPNATVRLAAGMYFSLPEESEITASGRTVVITRYDHKGFFQIGGPIEARGRLRYIDGCTDSLLVSPIMKGDPCLNLLHFPQYINQTAHTHPSARLGIVARGEGVCKIPSGQVRLQFGAIFCIPANAEHSFSTGDNSMSVIAYHPDSDYGPTHEEHPMINRTIVKGVSAARIDAIHTPPT